MPDESEAAPDFTVPLANGDVESFTLSDQLEEGPVVLAFFPGAFTAVCQTELCTFQDQLGEFEDVGASVFGVSVDPPFAQNEFRDQNDLSFGLLSDSDKSVIDAYGVRAADFVDLGYDASKRAVFVIDSDGTIVYSWVTDDPGVEPEYEAVAAAASDAA